MILDQICALSSFPSENPSETKPWMQSYIFIKRNDQHSLKNSVSEDIYLQTPYLQNKDAKLAKITSTVLDLRKLRLKVLEISHSTQR